MKAKLSVILITRDEEHDLAACLESVRELEPEIVVIDSGSTDRTREIARGFTPRVFERPFTDYASQKQVALDRASGEWVLSLDADERATPELREEIRSLLQGGAEGGAGEGIAGYEIPFRVRFMGRVLRFGGLGSEQHLRLFRREAGRFVGGLLHEGIEVRGRTARLRGRIEHIPYRDLDEYLSKMRLYTSYAAQKRLEEGRRFTPLHHILPLWEFFQRTVLRLGLHDGTAGLAWAGLSSFHTWLKYMKLRELSKEAGS